MDASLLASILVIALRILVPFTIFRFALAGGLLSILADAADVMIFEKFGYGLFGNGTYHFYDKFFDIYYLFFEMLVARQWVNMLARRAAVALFFWRFLGIILFEITHIRYLLLIFPNIFENFYIFWAVVLHYFPTFKLETYSKPPHLFYRCGGKLFIILLVVGVPKLIQEYIMHFRYVDQT